MAVSVLRLLCFQIENDDPESCLEQSSARVVVLVGPALHRFIRRLKRKRRREVVRQSRSNWRALLTPVPSSQASSGLFAGRGQARVQHQLSFQRDFAPAVIDPT